MSESESKPLIVSCQMDQRHAIPAGITSNLFQDVLVYQKDIQTFSDPVRRALSEIISQRGYVYVTEYSVKGIREALERQGATEADEWIRCGNGSERLRAAIRYRLNEKLWRPLYLHERLASEQNNLFLLLEGEIQWGAWATLDHIPDDLAFLAKAEELFRKAGVPEPDRFQVYMTNCKPGCKDRKYLVYSINTWHGVRIAYQVL